jgi:hypothetical protein
MGTGSMRQIVDYIKKNLSKGYTSDSLKWALISQGYSRTIVSKSIEIANMELAEQAPRLIEKPTITYEFVDETGETFLSNSSKKSWWKRWFGLG